MPAELQVLIRHIRRVAGRRELVHRSDRELLSLYAHERDEDAFAELVRRHAILVAGVCRRVLRNEQDIEDVFQATFLVLSRKARAVSWHESAANWLHSVAFHMAIRARKNALRQQRLERERHLQPTSTSATISPPQARELQELLDQELTRLPEACRGALILCYLEGRTRDQAARESGLSLRTLDRRLELGRELLRERLARRGLDLSVVVLAAALGESANAGYAKLTSATVQFVMQQASLKVGVASSALKFANSALSSVSVSSVNIVTGIILTMAMTAAGIGVFSQTAIRAHESVLEGNTKKSPSPQKDAKPDLPQPHLDLYGDPLPQGVMARLGSARFRFSFPDWIAFGPDGKELFTASQQGIKLFDAATGRALRTFGEELNTTCWSSAVSPDGKLAAIGGLEGSPSGVVYETATGKRLCELRPPNLGGTRLGGFSPDGSLLAAMPDSSRVDLYESRTGTFIRSLQSKNENQIGIAYGDIAFMPDGKILLMSSRRTGVIHFLDVLNGQELGQLTAIPHGIAGMVLAPDGSRLAVLESAPNQNAEFSPPGNRVMILEAQKGRLLTEFRSQNLSRQGMSFTRDSKHLFAGVDEKGIGIWDTTTGERKGSVPNTHTNEVWQTPMALAPDGKSIAYGDQACVRVCDIVTGKELESHQGHSTRIASAALHPFNSTVATSGRDGRLLLWDRTTGRMLREVFKGSGWAQSATYSADGKYLFAIVEFSIEPSHSSLRCWDSASGTEVWRLDNHPVQPGKLVIAPDGKMLAAIGHSAVVLIDSASGEPIRTLATEGEEFFLNGWVSMAELAFTADGSQLLAWGHTNGIHRWEIATGEHHVQACDHKIEATYAVAFSPDRKQLLTGGVSDHFDLVDVASGKTLHTIKAVCKEDRVIVLGATFSPDGRTFTWGGPRDSIVRLTDVATGTDRRQLKCFDGRCVPMAISNDGTILVTGAIDGTALIWALK